VFEHYRVVEAVEPFFRPSLAEATKSGEGVYIYELIFYFYLEGACVEN
jgi:hypothetical protein